MTDLQAYTQQVDELLDQMTLPEKLGQMTQIEKNSITPDAVREYFIGSVLSGGGGNPDPNTPADWREMVTDFIEASLETRLKIPLIYGSDAVHGHSNVVGATIFPHNIGLGATRNPDLIQRIGKATATEALATNVFWNFAPAVSVPQDVRWGRTFEGYSQNPDVVGELGAAYIRGTQSIQEHGEWVLPSVKHFAGDGGTTWGSRTGHGTSAQINWQAANENWKIDQGDTRIDEETFRRVHIAPYLKAIDEGAMNIMVSFSSHNGVKMHANHYWLTEVLKGELGFEGFLVSDWMAVDQIDRDFYTSIVKSINAGVDMVMVPYDYKLFLNSLTQAIENGDVSMDRIDDAVRRILRVKIALGLFEHPTSSIEYLDAVGSEAHRQIAADAVQQSLVLLKNENNALPLNEEASLLVAGQAAHDIGLACGGWTIQWQGGQGKITQGATLLEGLRNEGYEMVYDAGGNFSMSGDTAVVVIAEDPYAEGEGDREDLHITDDQRQLIERVRATCDKLVLIIYSGRPLIITDVVDHCDAVVAAWLPGSEADAMAPVLSGDVPFTGKLSYSWLRNMDQLPLAQLEASSEEPLYPFGHGLTL